MLELYFKTQRALVHSRPGPAGPFLEGFAEVLAKEHYGASAVENFVRAAAHLGAWMESKGLAIRDLDDPLFKEFLGHFLHSAHRRDNISAISGRPQPSWR